MWELLLSGLLVFGAVDVEVRSLDGPAASGRVTAWNADAIVLESGSETVTKKCRELLEVRPTGDAQAAQAEASVWVDLADGSVLAARNFSATDGQASVTLSDKSVVTMPTQQVAAVRLQQHDEQLAEQWQQIRALKAAADLVVVRKEDALDYYEGIIDKVTDEKVFFTYNGNAVAVGRSKVDGFVYFSAARQLPEVVCQLTCSDGSQLKAQSVELSSGKLQVKTLVDVTIAVPLEQMVRADYSFGKIQYLSDLTPRVQRWTPYIGFPDGLKGMLQFGKPRRDTAVDGQPLRLDGKTYTKGLALRSRTELTYRLPNKFQHFTAIAGLDDRVGDGGNVKLIVRGDGHQLLETTITGADAPREIDVDISGVSELTILVDYGDDQDVADHLNLCEARITK